MLAYNHQHIRYAVGLIRSGSQMEVANAPWRGVDAACYMCEKKFKDMQGGRCAHFTIDVVNGTVVARTTRDPSQYHGVDEAACRTGVWQAWARRVISVGRICKFDKIADATRGIRWQRRVFRGSIRRLGFVAMPFVGTLVDH